MEEVAFCINNAYDIGAILSLCKHAVSYYQFPVIYFFKHEYSFAELCLQWMGNNSLFSNNLSMYIY